MQTIDNDEGSNAPTLAEAEHALQLVTQAASDAKAAADLTSQRLADCERRLADLDAQIRGTDPDNAAALRKLSAERATTQAQRESLATRVQLASEAVVETESAAAAATVKLEEAHAARRAAEVKAAEERIAKLVSGFNDAAASAVELLGLKGSTPFEAVAAALREKRERARRNAEQRWVPTVSLVPLQGPPEVDPNVRGAVVVSGPPGEVRPVPLSDLSYRDAARFERAELEADRDE